MGKNSKEVITSDYYSSLDGYIESVETYTEDTMPFGIDVDSPAMMAYSKQSIRKVTYAIPNNLIIDIDLIRRQAEQGLIHDFDLEFPRSGTKRIVIHYFTKH